MTERQRIIELLKNENKAIKLALFEAQRHKRQNDASGNPKDKYGEVAYHAWEAEEKGSIQGMRLAYNKTFSDESFFGKLLSRDVIEQIRGSFYEGGAKYGNPKILKQGPSAIATENREFGIPKITDEQKKQIEHDARSLMYLMKKNNVQSSVYLNDSENLPYTIGDGITGGTVMSGADHENIESYYDFIINRYNAKISKPDLSEDEKLTSIVKLSRDLERIHPYADFNCRTFCVLVLNRELVKHNMTPSLMEDPNVFDYLPLDELKTKVRDGQKNYEHLRNSSEHLVHPGDPTVEEWKRYRSPALSVTDDPLTLSIDSNTRLNEIPYSVEEYVRSIDLIDADINASCGHVGKKMTNPYPYLSEHLSEEAQRLRRKLEAQSATTTSAISGSIASSSTKRPRSASPSR